MLALIVAGEAIFGLPFHLIRFFRPTVLAVFGFSNVDIGELFAAYGVVAMISYFPGGPLADRFSARRLMTASLLLTGLSGFFFATLPALGPLTVLYGFFGATTILLFWAAMIRATRELGGTDNQGVAFGILDGGRGLFAAGLASIALVPFSLALGDDPTQADPAAREAAMRNVIYLYTASTLAAAALVWFFVPESKADADTPAFRPAQVLTVLKMPSIWLQAGLLVCAYVAYKGIDYYSLYAVDGYGLNEVEGARVSVIGSWTRPIAAVAAGFFADRTRPTTAAALCFAVLFGGHLSFAFVPPSSGTAILWANVVVTCAVAFGLRGVYFAIMEEVKIPHLVTGTAVGIISVVGFTPDIFVAPVAGALIDGTPGVAGFQQFFVLLAAFSFVGLACAVLIRRFVSQ
ncbi:MAG: MFS transporter [Deltaproteobacteria bacterium]|jgi:nitrate/nitrite transporter NarK